MNHTASPQTQDTLAETSSALESLLTAAVLANEGELRYSEEDGWSGRGDAVDVALLFMGKKAGYEQDACLQHYPERDRIPYESERKYAASIHDVKDQPVVYVKGALEAVLEMCDHQAGDDGQTSLDVEALRRQAEQLSAEQYRVLAFASGEMPDQDTYSGEDLTGLTFLGIVGMRDPLRDGVREAITSCHDAGIRVAMITGDHPDTANAIARELGITRNGREVITGSTLTESRDEPDAIDRYTAEGRVYARVEPTQKLDIIHSLTRQGHFVAVTGDGVNDAPALKHAHVGVAMGRKGTDVARESADIILTDDNFASIVAGVEEGRVAFDNIRNIVYFLTSKGLSEVLLFIAAIAANLPVPLYATQLLWLNFVTNGIQDVAHAFDPKDGDELKRPPRDPSEPIFNRLMITRVVIAGLTIFAITLAVYITALERFAYTVAEARNLTLLQLVLFGNIIALNSRSENRSFFQQHLMKNPVLIYGIIAAQGLHIAAMYIPGLSDVLRIQPVSFAEWAILLGLALVLMVVIELEKWVRRRLADGR